MLSAGARYYVLVVLASWAVASAGPAEDPPVISFQSGPGRLEILVARQPLATYVYQDDSIPRPYIAHVRAPGGIQVTRSHPPVPGKDATDHATLHPGLWLAFGDLGRADSWRNRAPVKHEKFIEGPKGGAGRGSFAVRNQYLSSDGKKIICRETCRYTYLARPFGYLLVWESEFCSPDADFAFGDQEEMGLGIRVATPLAVPQGGRLLTSAGATNEKQVRGTQADWCDYSGTIHGHRAGVMVMPDPKNFRPSWYHARDYGLMVANPFGRKALFGGEASSVVVRKGDKFRLRFGILLHASKTGLAPDLDGAYKDYLQQLASLDKKQAPIGLEFRFGPVRTSLKAGLQPQ